MQFQIFSFLTILLGCETLRLCQQGETENCLLDVPRLEIRHLDSLQRKHLINAFRGEKMQHKRKEWEQILEGDLAHDLIRRLDDRLSIEGFFTPFWDSKIDRRLAKPEDSTLFHDDFLPRQTSRKERATRPNERRKDSHPLADIRKTKNSQLFFILHEVAKTKGYLNESCASLCAIKNEWLFCDRLTDRCVATVSLGGNCTTRSRNAFTKVCFKSECVKGVCTAVNSQPKPSILTMNDKETVKKDHKREHRKKNKSRQKTQKMATTTTTTEKPETTTEVEGSGTMDALEELIHEADQILNAATTSEPGKAERRRTFRNLFIKPLDDEIIGNEKPNNAELEITLSLPTEIPHKAVYSIQVSGQGLKDEATIDVVGFKPVTTTTESRSDLNENDEGSKDEGLNDEGPNNKRAKDKRPNDVPAVLREESSTPYFQDISISKIPIATRLPQKGSPMLTGEYLPRNAILFDAPAPFPTVYFTVTVIEGEYRKRIRRQRFASGVTAYTTGANMPSGYTQTFEGKALNGTTVLRALDPQVAGILTEFNVTVVDSRGLPCQQMCKYEAKNSYRPCPTDVIRLSTFAQYTDDIPTYQNSLEASQAAWLGQGYFRRRKADYLVYKCRSEKRMRRRDKQSR